MSDDERTENLVDFVKLKERAEAGAPFTHRRHPFKLGECRHARGFDVDTQDHEVTCRACGKIVDAFKAITIVAFEWDWNASHESRKELEAQVTRLSAEVDKLKAIRSRERAELSIPGKHVRKALRDLAELLKRYAAGDRARGDKKSAGAYESAAHRVRTTAEHLVDGFIQGEGKAEQC